MRSSSAHGQALLLGSQGCATTTGCLWGFCPCIGGPNFHQDWSTFSFYEFLSWFGLGDGKNGFQICPCKISGYVPTRSIATQPVPIGFIFALCLVIPTTACAMCPAVTFYFGACAKNTYEPILGPGLQTGLRKNCDYANFVQGRNYKFLMLWRHMVSTCTQHQHRGYGCRVIQRLIEYCASVQISALLDEVLQCCGLA